MRPHRAPSLLQRRVQPPLLRRQLLDPSKVPGATVLTTKSYSTLPPADRFRPKISRFSRFLDPSEEIRDYHVRNPLNYVDVERRTFLRNQVLQRRIYACLGVVVVIIGVQFWLLFTFDDPEQKEIQRRNSARASSKVERLDAPPTSDGAKLTGNERVVVQTKPGNPGIKIDAHGRELIDTGTSSIPHFPRFIRLPSTKPDPSATPDSTSSSPNPAFTGEEEYTLLGLGIRKVSFLRVQVYVLGLYVRTTDLEKLQAAFVKHVNPLGSSLIPGEKEQLRAQLLAQDPASLELWDKILKENRLRSCVRIVPTRSTDFNHLRDGWVTGITSRTRELAQKQQQDGGTGSEFTDESFGQAMQDFKALLGGRGKAPKGSTVLLTRDENGAMMLLFEPEVKQSDNQGGQTTEVLGQIADERISRQVWLGYLGGKNVSSEDARKSIVDGVMELVARPVGTVETQVS